MKKYISEKEVLALIERLDPKYKPVWHGKSQKDQIALAKYFLPHRSSKPVIGPTRPRILKWYCPFACQKSFPSGHRYCINVYTGCDHKCIYCYAAGYEPENANIKQSFEKKLSKDMDDLERFDVPPAPVHLSNSTDAFQPLEKQHGHTQYALEQILEHRHRFATVTILTKNPMLPVELGYIELFKALLDYHPTRSMCQDNQQRWPGFVIEVSMAFWQETARAVYDPGAPTVKQRIEGIRALHEAGIPLVLRIDPLFPRSPITGNPGKNMTDFGLPEAQTIDDLDKLVALAKEVNVKHIVYSASKIVQPISRKLSKTMMKLKDVYQAYTAPEKLIWRGGSWRLPFSIIEQRIVTPFLEICRNHGVKAKYCKQNLIETP